VIDRQVRHGDHYPHQVGLAGLVTGIRADVLWVGTSGWQYRDWRGQFYPGGLPQRQWLAHYCAGFDTVELNNSFYRLPAADAFRRWREQVGPGFCFAVKASRYLTHIKRLRDPSEPVARLLGRARELGEALGPVLLQLPPTLAADPDLLDRALREFPADIRVAVEPRHRSWWTDDVRAVLEKHGAALAWADRRSRAVTPVWSTAEWGYLRLHQGLAMPSPRYGKAALRGWLERIDSAFHPLNRHDVYVYFNNDTGGAAIADAAAFGRQASRHGIAVSRFPESPPG
jgi:uncharacterized protein YecE (DUF72 family)